jgi:hypothetical protein
VNRLGFASYIAIAVLLSSGCSSVKSTYLTNGQKGFLVTCRGPLKRWSNCVTLAGRVCRSRGYVVSYQDEIDHELLVSCAARDSAVAAAAQP